MKPSFKSWIESKRLFIDRPDDDGGFMLKINRVFVEVTTAFGDTVTFSKTNRGQVFHDSREPKKSITETECLSELIRLLDDKLQGDAALATLLEANYL